MTFRLHHLYSLAPLFILAACGGGGSDDDDEEDFLPEDADASGIWVGTVTRDGGDPIPAYAIVSADGDFVITSSLIFYGSGTTSADSFFGSAVAWAPVLAPFANDSFMGDFSLSGTVTDNPRSITGAFDGAGEMGNIAFDLDAELTNRAADLELVAGVYSGTGGLATVSITSNMVTLNASLLPDYPNCIGNGTISVPAGHQNIYKWELELSGCPNDGVSEGLAFLDTNRLVMYGRSAQAPSIFVGTK